MASAMVLLPLLARAQVVQYDFEIIFDVNTPSSLNVAGRDFFGNIVVDLDQLVDEGEPGRQIAIIDSGLRSVYIEFYDGNYTHESDISNGFPRAFFTDGVLTGIDIWNNTGLISGREEGLEDTFFRFFRDQTFEYSPRGNTNSLDGEDADIAGEFSGSYVLSPTFTVVPEPTSSALLFLASLFFLMGRRRSSHFLK